MTEVMREPVPGMGRTAGGGTDTVTCPECGTRAALDLLRRDASAFCPQCDYPLFWADRGGARAAASDADPAPVRRSPGVEGELAGVVVACLVCGEHNAHARGPCVRCGSDLTPRPAPVLLPPPAPEPAPQVVQVPVAVPCAHPRTWVVALLAALLGAGVAFVVTMVVLT
ncbi:hypothetical protein [Cellulomonas dongxiuzhuiae]|uniref:hypothetical protein n=1 Tax=Cellulomonas dongxiuzhuiae TaxID=2819979 RepID=UPI001AAEA8D1|nr:hypothetical protein [Cellulomonas dongxiuzhuiae]MBO3088033.1 hypothetical protein [Cellulomonas dongxiuzhuiae]